MIERSLGPRLLELVGSFPVLTLTGPRQSGKTTLCRALFPDHRYLSLEPFDRAEQARRDPRGFLEALGGPAVLDEVQRVPELLSYIQGIVDEDPIPGRFVLTGSANFALLASVTQSLAGRTAVAELMPCTWDEVGRFASTPEGMLEAIWTGSYPAIFDRSLPVAEWYRGYLTTYLERDVRSLLNVSNLAAFQDFLVLVAGRSGQLLNLSELGRDAGVSHATARAWLSVLEAAYLVFRVRPFQATLTSRMVKSPKLYFYDTGVLCALLGITEPGQLQAHPLRGAVFETWVAAEVLKCRTHAGVRPGLSFVRDSKGFEVDLLVDAGPRLVAAEVKSGRTLMPGAFEQLRKLPDRLEIGRPLSLRLVYGGEEARTQFGVEVVPWRRIDEYEW